MLHKFLNIIGKSNSKLQLVLKEKCPNCMQGQVFEYAAYSRRFMKMYKNCPVCGFQYEIETGFFWGSMYISYGISVIISILLGVGTYFLLHDPEVWVYLCIIGGVIVGISPVNFRLSRMLMLHYFSFIKNGR